MILDQYHYRNERIDAPSSCALRCRGVVTIRIVISHSTHAFRNIWLYLGLYSASRSALAVAILLVMQESLVCNGGNRVMARASSYDEWVIWRGMR
jgi:hypothetical protein